MQLIKAPGFAFQCEKGAPHFQGAEILRLVGSAKIYVTEHLLRIYWQKCHLRECKGGRDDQTWEFICFYIVKTFFLPVLELYKSGDV